ncbi:MAG: DUF1295 domain-containing protein [Acidobacteriota bacterium]|nr:DUF1295 domain-containing protein [Acidobacteriota bacterium]
MLHETFDLLALGASTVAVLMFVLWLIHLRTGNAAIVDAGWAGGLSLLAAIYAAAGPGDRVRSGLVAVMAAAWGLRLALYVLVTRVIGQPEEGRYVELRRTWRTHLPLKFLGFFEFQALVAVILSVPFLLPALNPAPGLQPVEYAGGAIWLIGFLGEVLADAQLHRFKANPAHRGRTCRVGLWRWSRHPNYFFEWVIWIGFAVFALGSPWGAAGLLSPALILYFLLRVTGIPATEAQALRSRGDEYRQYQRTTSPFIPWFPRRLKEGA